MLEIFSVASPVFVRVTACGELVLPTFWEPKLIELTEIVATGPMLAALAALANFVS